MLELFSTRWIFGVYGIWQLLALESLLSSQVSCRPCFSVSWSNLITEGHSGTVGLVEQSESITDLSFDILSLEALFLVPRQVLEASNIASATGD